MFNCFSHIFDAALSSVMDFKVCVCVVSFTEAEQVIEEVIADHWAVKTIQHTGT